MVTEHIAHQPSHGAVEEHHHPGAKTYVGVGAVLLVITILEVLALYMHFLGPLFVPTLLLLMALKFILVVGYYMHLKFDHRLLTYLFGAGLLTATLILVGFVALLNYDLSITAQQVIANPPAEMGPAHH